MEKVRQGVINFHDFIFPQQREFFESLAKAQRPRALFITCSDSRVHPNLITQTEPGDLFILRNPGNIVPPYSHADPGSEAATIEYAVEVLGVEDIITCGHSNCGAMSALLRRSELSDLPSVVSWLHYAESTLRVMQKNFQDLPESERIRVAIEQNVLMQIEHLKTHPSVAARVASGHLHLYGWVYDIGAGDVSEFDPERREFVSLTRNRKSVSV
ncbi:MAG: carbonate dehydratase [Planctomycetota bacterium]|nr:MAG: carbonate dehydratase [Planctomycetota bacterium]